jgi:hypothetical protein
MLQPPIVVDGKSELLLFRDLKSAEAFMEAVDIHNGEYAAAYDSEGRRLEVRTKSVKRRVMFGLLSVHIECADLRPTEEEAGHTAEFSELLRTYVGGSTDLSHKTVGELVAIAIDQIGFTR